MSNSPDYRDAYRRAERELADLVSEKDRIEKRTVIVRQSLETLAALCESESVQMEPSAEAAYLLQNSTISDEIRAVLTSAYPKWLRPLELKDHLEKLGHDLSKHVNPLATIHMVLKRMAESGEIEEQRDAKDKVIYRGKPTSEKVSDFWDTMQEPFTATMQEKSKKTARKK